MKLVIAALASISSIALAGKSDLEQKPTAVPYLHASSTSVSGTGEMTVKGGAGEVKTESSKTSLSDRRSKN